MHNVVLTPIAPEKLVEQITEKVTANILEILSAQANHPGDPGDPGDPLDDFIPKHEVRGKLASSATLWKWEKAGKIKSYGIGGKRFYKRSELTEAITEMK